MKKSRKHSLLYKAVLLLILISVLLGCKAEVPPQPSLTLTVFSCGKADAMLLQFDGYNVMIDTGENGDGEDLVKELVLRQVEKIDLLILTHHDKDHIGGADTVLENLPVTSLRMPAYESDSKQYVQLTEALKQADVEVFRMSEDATFSLGGADFTIWTSTVDYNGKNDNEQSLVTKVVYGGKSFLFMGDAEEAWLKELCLSGRNLTCNVLKLPHHGVYDKNLITLLPLTLPEYVLITDSVKNPAEEKTMDLLKTFELATYSTANGSIRLTLTNGQLRIAQF